MRKLLVPAVLILMSLPGTPARAQEVPTTRFKEVSSRTFTVQGLEFTIEDLTRNQIMGATTRFASRANITLRIRNTGSAFAPFGPQDLALVGKSGVQVSPLCELNGTAETECVPRRIAPGATVEVRYILSGKIQLPAKVYLAGTLVTEIQE